MTEIDQALLGFFSGFNLPVYREDDVPYGVKAPYITVSVSQPTWDAAAPIYAHVWYRSASYAAIDAKVDQIAEAIGHSGVSIPTATGCVWLYRANPFAQHRKMAGDPTLQCVYLNMTVQAITL